MENFIEKAMRTESSNFCSLMDSELRDYSTEFTDAVKKALFYGKDLDVTNLKEELGDLMWYMAIAMEELGTDFETESNRVINKLKVRYPEKFTNELAENRDLEAERRVLEDDQEN